MKSRPIFFKGEDIRAMLAGEKTQEWRVVMSQPPEEAGKVIGPEMYEPCAYDKHGEMVPGDPVFGIYDDYGEWGVTCPYGQPGDQLWVKEPWLTPFLDEWVKPSEMPENTKVIYKATHKTIYSWWLSSIYMPRWASRLTLEIAEVQVQWKEEELWWVFDFKVIRE